MFSSVLKSDRIGVRSAAAAIAISGALALAFVLALAGTAKANPIASGSTSLFLNKGVVNVLKKNGVKVAPIRPAKVQRGAVAFPITGGQLNPSTAVGTIRHSGGLRFQAGKKRLVARNFTVRTGKGNVLVARVGKANVRLLTVDLKRARVGRNGLGINVTRVKVALTGAAANALNKTFRVRLFKRGLVLGSVVVKTQPGSVGLAAQGSTDLTLDPVAAGALTSLGISVAPIDPAAVTPAGDIAFPITGGRADTSTFAGAIRHSGGISLTKGATVVNLTDFTINVDGDPDLTAILNGGDRVSILDLDLSALTVDVTGRNITLGNASAALTAGAASALSGAFGETIPAGLVLGSATVNASAR
jgi:hypothetical protein